MTTTYFYAALGVGAALGLAGAYVWLRRPAVPRAPGLSEADCKVMAQHGRRLSRYYAVDFMRRYASLTFELTPEDRETLLASYPESERAMPGPPFGVVAMQEKLPGLTAWMRAQGALGDGYAEIKRDFELRLARQAHEQVLQAIRPHLRLAEDEAEWERLRKAGPRVVV